MPEPLRAERPLPALDSLPRPFFPRAESLSAGTFSAVHRHPWGQLSYAIEGVLDIRTPAGNYVALPQCAVWIPAGLEHQVINLGRVEMRSFYCDPALFPWDDGRCRVLRVTLLVRELIRAASALPPDYPPDGPEARLVRVLADQLAALPEAAFALAMPRDRRLQAIAQALLDAPGERRTLAQWAAQSGSSERHLARLFQRETGLPFRLWRQRLRLMLSLGGLESGHPVTRVALDYGYDSPSSYIAAFKALFGRTPGGLEGR
ncbi:AraC family transcriptional regulator [Propionivibrio sp.]|uniref:AraC family transcriptional regulator n=1 Tax=Propionivibrio sp. TaxID=2212460 RepID=UPI0039E47930